MFCLLPALIILSHSFSGMLETWCEQVMAEQWREARYGGWTAGQPAVFKSITTSSSSASTTIAEGSSNSAVGSELKIIKKSITRDVKSKAVC